MSQDNEVVRYELELLLPTILLARIDIGEVATSEYDLEFLGTEILACQVDCEEVVRSPLVAARTRSTRCRDLLVCCTSRHKSAR